MKDVLNLNSIAKHEQIITQIKKASGQDISRCYQCGKCTAGCPLAAHVDFTPNQVIRMLQLGLVDQVLKCQTIWLCVYCSTCSVRCPCSIELAEVMDALRVLAQREKIKPAGRAKKVFLFNKNFLGSLRKFGRLHELLTMLFFNLQRGKPFDNVETGMFMLAKGKLKFLIPPTKGKEEVKRIFTEAEKLEENKA